MIQLHIFEFTCARCGARFKEGGRSSNPERLLMRGEGSGALVSVNVADDEVFSEVVSLVREVVPAGITEARLGELARDAFSVACDRDSEGMPYSFRASPRCPVCKSNTMAEWVATDPPEFIDDQAPSVTHQSWIALASRDRRSRIEGAVMDALSA